MTSLEVDGQLLLEVGVGGWEVEGVCVCRQNQGHLVENRISTYRIHRILRGTLKRLLFS